MTLNQFITCLIIFWAFTFITSCGDVTGSSDTASFMDSEEGEWIIPADDQHLSKEQRARYLQDAEKLAVRYINEKDSTQTTIPGNLINLLYNGLIHIVNSNHPKVEKATEEYAVHAGNPVNPREILVIADTTASWIDAWREGETQTGNKKIDELIDEFNLTLADYNEGPNTLPTATATLRSDHAINVFAVARLFGALDDTEHTEVDQYTTDGNDISVLFFDDHLRYTFEYGFNDCPAGCSNRHFWHFNVYRDGTVEFDGEKGDPLPED